jgi:hypothetical protein
MAIKRAITTNSKSAGFSKQILILQNCQAQDRVQLEKIYPKVLADIDKAISRVTQEQKKSKAKTKPAKGTKGAARLAKAKPANLASLEKQLDGLKAERALIVSGHKKLLAQKKALQQFEKAWAKKSSATQKNRKKVKSVRKQKAAESSFLQNLVEAE